MRIRRLISKELQEEILRRFQAGESKTKIAEDIGFTRQGVSNIIDKFLEPEKVKAKAEARLTKRLTEPEIEQLKTLLKTTEPEDHDPDPPSFYWNKECAIWLANKKFGKKPSVALVQSLLKPLAIKKTYKEIGDPKPEPPKPFDIRKVDPELAKDKGFVRYCQSPIARQIAWRSYECALKEWEERNAKKTAAQETEKTKFPVSKIVGKRVGKHAGSRQSNLTKKKKRRR